MLAPFFASFLIMNCIFFLVKLIPFLDIVLEFNISFADFIRSFSYLFPNMLLYSIPMAAMMGIIIGFTRLCNDSEILAFKACGISIYNVLPPVIVVSLIISIITAYFSIKLIPAGEIALKQLMFQLAKEKIDKGIKQKQFTAALGDLVVYVNEVDKKTNEWKDVWVSDMRGQKTPTITMAQSGTMKTDLKTMVITIILNNGSLHRSTEKQSQIITFNNYTINIPLTLPATNTTVIGIAAMNMKQLAEKAELHGKSSKLGRRYLVHYHKRMALPVGCLIMSLMALPLGLQAGPGKRAAGIPLGLVFFIIYYVVHTIGKTTGEESTVVPVGIAMWTPNLIFSILTVATIMRVAEEKPLFPESLSSLILTIKQKLRYTQKKTDINDHKLHSANQTDGLNTDEVTQEGKVRGNAFSHVYHLPGCDFYSCLNCTDTFDTVEAAIEAGYEPCRFCKNNSMNNAA